MLNFLNSIIERFKPEQQDITTINFFKNYEEQNKFISSINEDNYLQFPKKLLNIEILKHLNEEAKQQYIKRSVQVYYEIIECIKNDTPIYKRY